MGRNAVLNRVAESDRLSRYEVRVLAALSDAHGHEHEDAVVTRTRHLPEWTEPAGNGSAVIAPEAILRAAGRTGDEIATTAQHAAEAFLLRTLA